MEAGSLTIWAGRRFGAWPAVQHGSRVTSYATLGERTARLANALRALGVTKGDRIAHVLPKCTEAIECDLAISMAGAVSFPISRRLSAEDILAALGKGAPRAIITTEDDLERIGLDRLKEEVLIVVVEAGGSSAGGTHKPQESWLWYDALLESGYASPPKVSVDPDRDARMIRLTSGTTGKPKLVISSHRAWMAAGYALLIDRYALAREDVLLGGGAYPHTWLTACLLRGACVFVVDKFDAEEVVACLAGSRVTVLQLVPTMLRRLLDVPGVRQVGLSGLHAISYGSGSIDRGTLDEAMDLFGPVLIQGYGLNEAPNVAALTCEDHAVVMQRREPTGLQPIGKESLLSEVRLRGDDGAEVVDGNVGELEVRGPTVMSGYWGDDEATARVVREGWLQTGDLMVRDAETGYLYLAGRRNDMIVTGGLNVYPSEVENVIAGHPAVNRCAVIGLPDREWGEIVVAVVIQRPGADTTEEELIAFCRARMSGYRKPRRVLFADELPLTSNDKVQRAELRRRVMGGEMSTRGPAGELDDGRRHEST
jgi:acyl-CoA synthetase (AMP-forming)/AMP-acid ligase II